MPRSTIARFLITACAAIVAMSNAAMAQQGLVAPQPANQAQPPLPTNTAGRPTEGWAVVRYSVLADGTTSNVRVVDIVPPRATTQGTMTAVAGWTFTPGTEDGEAIDWHNNESVIAFRCSTTATMPSPR